MFAKTLAFTTNQILGWRVAAYRLKNKPSKKKEKKEKLIQQRFPKKTEYHFPVRKHTWPSKPFNHNKSFWCRNTQARMYFLYQKKKQVVQHPVLKYTLELCHKDWRAMSWHWAPVYKEEETEAGKPSWNQEEQKYFAAKVAVAISLVELVVILVLVSVPWAIIQGTTNFKASIYLKVFIFLNTCWAF